MRRTKTSFTLRDDLVKDIKVQARINSWSMSRLVEIGMRDWIDIKKKLHGSQRKTARVALV
jgi:hypothetical protein